MNLKRGLSAYLPVRNGFRLDYPWREVGASLLGVADELILCDSDSSDGTREAMEEWAKVDPRISVINWPWPMVPTPEGVARSESGPPGRPRLLIEWLNYCRQFCRYDIQITSDADEILCPKGYDRIREAVKKRECLYFFRLNFWRDHRHITQNDKVVGSYVARLGPTEFEMVSDEMRPEGEPPIRRNAVKHDSLRFFHVGFIRKQGAFFEKSKVVQAALHNTYDPRLIEAEKKAVSWFDLTDVGELVPYNDNDWPACARPWMSSHGYDDSARIIHVAHFMGTPDSATERRMKIASDSWREEYGRYPGHWNASVYHPARDSHWIGDSKSVPYVRDLIFESLQYATAPRDIIFLTNCDVGFAPGITDRIRRAVASNGACHMRRREFDKVDTPFRSQKEISTGGEYSGMDGCAFSIAWWEENGLLFPDMILGRYGWDSAMRNMIRRSGGVELKNELWHETHASDWNATPEEIANNPSNAHNRALLGQWLATYGGDCEDHLFTTEQLKYR